MARQFRAGSRRMDGKMSDNRFAWMKGWFGQINMYVYPPGGNSTPEEDLDDIADGVDARDLGDTVRLMVPQPGRRPFSLNLTAATSLELLEFKRFMDLAIAHALPICQQRDKIAQEAFDNGDDSYSRSYRQLPQLVVRGRSGGEHSAGVLAGHEDVPGVDDGAEADGDEGQLRRDGGAVAERVPSDEVPQDNELQAD